GVAESGNVFEEDLFLKILRTSGDEHALALEDRRHQIRERFSGTGSRFGQQHAATVEYVGDGFRHRDLSGSRLEVRQRPSERASGRERLANPIDVRVRARLPRVRGRWLHASRARAGIAAYASGYRGNFRHTGSTS